MPKVPSESPISSLSKNNNGGTLKRNQVILLELVLFHSLKAIGGLSSMQETEIGKVTRRPLPECTD